MINKTQLQDSINQLNKVEQKLSDPNIYSTPEAKSVISEQKYLKQKVDLLKQYFDLSNELEQTKLMLTDPELADLASTEKAEIEKKLGAIEAEIKQLLVKQDPNDIKNAIIEIRAGAGGDESSLFAAELARMYARYAEGAGIKLNILSQTPNELGGYKEIIFEAVGEETYKLFKYESGVHRVQRVPATESAGRLHTSTVTVVVLPEAEEEDLIIDPKELRIDVYRSSGHGGQSVNTTDSAVRITHLPSGIVVTCQDEKSQLKNKLKAMNVLRSRLLLAKEEEERKSQGEARLSQIGTGDRSEKIRTYNFPQDRITDHRINFSTHGISSFMDGNIGGLINALQKADIEAKIKASENNQ